MCQEMERCVGWKCVFDVNVCWMEMYQGMEMCHEMEMCKVCMEMGHEMEMCKVCMEMGH
jgi:hypothetical protein